ncbi:NUDIX domain-containing protein [Corynebacterium kroppenstedtii]|uniref:NUDIX hydrolase n=1 Tax=Corynebacterium sp. PCR 32 TaxID=3351342 RepID=UPI003097BAD0
MATPQFIVELRAKIGHDPLWLPGVTVVVLRDALEPSSNALEAKLEAPVLSTRREVLLVRRVDNGEWTPVTGIVDPGEHPHVAAVREVEEETRARVTIESLLNVQAVGPVTYPNGDVTSYVDTAFRASLREDSPEVTVGDDESHAVTWFPIDALPRMQPRFQAIIQRAADDADHGVAATWGPLPCAPDQRALS